VHHIPFASLPTVVSTFVWLLALSYLYLEISTEERAMGVFILPIAIGLQTISALTPGTEKVDPVLESPWFWIHVASLLCAYASFALAGVLGLTYMLQFKEIKKKHLGYLYNRLPSLLTLDVMNSRAMTIGWVLLTVGVTVGVVWAEQARVTAPDDPNLRAMTFKGHILYMSKRAIRQGEELTLDYKYRTGKREDNPCACGAPSCRGSIILDRREARGRRAPRRP